MMKHFLTLLTFLSLTWNVSAQTEPKSEFAKDFLPVWNTSTSIAIQVAEAMPENLYDFKPNDSSMTFRQQLIHLGYTSYFLMDYFTLFRALLTFAALGNKPNGSFFSF